MSRIALAIGRARWFIDYGVTTFAIPIAAAINNLFSAWCRRSRSLAIHKSGALAICTRTTFRYSRRRTFE
jgi:hypothetical protein